MMKGRSLLCVCVCMSVCSVCICECVLVGGVIHQIKKAHGPATQLEQWGSGIE